MIPERMRHDGSGSAEKEALKPKANAWRKRFEASLKEVMEDSKSDRAQLLEVIWEDGIMGRILPDDPEEKEAREKLHKAVWSGERTDPKLYWRIMYSAAASREGMRHGWSIMSSGDSLVVGAFDAINRSVEPEKKLDFYPELKTDQKVNPYEIIFADIISRAKAELENLGVTPPQELIPMGAKGEYKGIKVKIDRYTFDGKVYLQAENYEGHEALYKLSAGMGVDPDELDLESFK